MKKIFLFSATVVICLFTIIVKLNAQGNFTTTWALTANASTVTTGATSTVVASDMLPGATFSAGAYNTSGFACKSPTTWPNTITAGYYLDFPVSSATGFDIQIDSFAVVAKVSSSSGNNILNFAYIIDTAAPVTITGSQTTASSGGTTTIKMTAFSSPVTCTAGHTMTIRMWAYSATTTTTSGRSLYIKNMQLEGITTTAIVPVSFNSLSINKNNNGLGIQWSVGEQTNIQYYLIERAIDGINFNNIATVKAINGQYLYNTNDNIINSKSVYYRVIAISDNGEKIYSRILSFKSVLNQSLVKIAPNPVINKQFELQVADITKGQYKLTICNQSGAVVFTHMVQIEGDSQSQTIQLPSSLAKGVYFANFNGAEVNNNQTLIVE